MDEIEQRLAELEALKKKQALHRQQLEENRSRALAKKKQTKRLVTLGQMVEAYLPDAENLSEEEIREILKKRLKNGICT